MAVLTFRQSADTITDAQANPSNGHIVKGVPLTMFEIDANFKALNDEGESYRKKYGLGVGQEQTDVLSLQQAFNTNDANNIRNTGFYRVYNTANTPLAAKNGSVVTAPNSVLIHAQSFATPTESEVTALQLTCNSVNGLQSVYFRTKQGNSTWNNWQALATEANVSSGNIQINQLIDSCVKKSGDTITGVLTVQQPTTLTGNNTIDSINVVKGETPTADDYTGFTVYDKTDTNIGSTKMAYFGFNQSTSSQYSWLKNFSGVLLSASNPKETVADQTVEARIGWIPDPTGTTSQWKSFMSAPTPFVDNGTEIANLVATTGWVENRLTKWASDNQTFGANGGTITGDVIIEKTLSVLNDVSVSKALSVKNNIVSTGSMLARLSHSKPSLPSASVGTTGNGFVVVDNSVTSSTAVNRTNTASRFWGRVSSDGIVSSSMEAFNWAAALSDASVKEAKIEVSISMDGSAIKTYAPTPPVGDDSTQIVTTEWANDTIDTKIDVALANYEANHPWDMGVL